MNRYAHSQTITVARPAPVDVFGDPAGPAQTHTVEDVVIAPTSSTEQHDHGVTVITGYTLLPPPGADIRPSDRIRLPSDPPAPEGADAYTSSPWAVSGEVVDYASPFTGWTPGGLLQIVRVS